MCGIAGLLQKSPIENETIDRMAISIKHRGPDEKSAYIFKNSVLINTRLSIIDVAAGQQPKLSDDENIAVIQNGEIYNFVEVRDELIAKGVHFKTRSDTEVILRAYETYGDSFVSRLNGMFAIGILDKKKNQLALYRDRLGVKPLFLYQAEGIVAFSSEIKTFIEIPQFKREVNSQSVFNYFTYNYIPLPNTIFKNVTHVMPGTWVKVDLTSLKIESSKYWSLENSAEIKSMNEDQLIDQIHELLLDATQIRLRSDVPVSAFLSGGLDSSLVCQYMVLAGLKEFSTYSIGFHEKEFDESEYFNYVNDLLGLKAHSFFLSDSSAKDWETTTYFNDQPHGDTSFIPTYFLSSKCAQNFKVALTGDGGDELFAGYEKYKILESCSADSQKYFDHISLFNSASPLTEIFTHEFLGGVDVAQPFDLYRSTIRQVSSKDDVNKALYFDVSQLLPGNNLVKPDRMAMAHSLEARSPFLDYRLYELLFQLPGHFKLQQGDTKYLLKKLALRYFRKEHVYRSKQMFTVPMGEWFKTRLKEFLLKTVESPNLEALGILNMATIKSMAQQHVSGTKNYTRELRAIANLEIWSRQFLK